MMQKLQEEAEKIKENSKESDDAGSTDAIDVESDK
jgi:hypothetical protein